MIITSNRNVSRSGFTIVELLIVVVVIAILAAITIVSYNGITRKAKEAVIENSLVTLQQKLEVFRITENTSYYPGDLNSIDLSNTDEDIIYAANNTTVPSGYCMQQTLNDVTYYVTETLPPTEGLCDENYGIVGWWKFNGSNSDSSAKAWTITTSGSPGSAVGQNGQANNAYSFNGTNTALAAGGFWTGGIEYGAVSISGWVYPAATTAAQGYFGVRTNTADPQFYILEKASSNDLECRIYPTGAPGYVDAGSVSITPNTWNFVVLIFNGSSAQCFVNGVGGAQTAISGSFNFPSGNPFVLGRVSTSYLNGRLDDVRGYTRVLSAGEIESMYREGAQ